MMKVLFVCLMSLALLAPSIKAAEVTIAVASNFAKPMKQLVNEFERETGHQAKLSYASSGKFYAQIQHGAPYDVFLSADHEKPQKLIQLGLAVDDSLFTYAVGRLALWSVDSKYIDDQGNALKQGKFKHLAMADPKLAPYGLAAQQTLKVLSLFESLQPKIVQGENISQTYQFVFTGNAKLGFVAWSQIVDAKTAQLKSGSAWLVPTHYHDPIQQQAVLLKRAKDKPAAQAFITFLQSEKAQAIIQSAGYEIAAKGKD